MSRRAGPSRLARCSPYLLAGVLAVAGAAHAVAPRPYARIVPDFLPAPYLLVYLSGAAQVACAAGLVSTRTRRRAAWATAALFVAIFPANVQMALESAGRSEVYRAVVLGRLPLQVPLIAWAVAIARSSRPRG